MGKIPTDSWIVVADGGKARMLRNVGGEGSALPLMQDQVLDAQDMMRKDPRDINRPRLAAHTSTRLRLPSSWPVA